MVSKKLVVGITGANSFVGRNFRKFLAKKEIPTISFARKNFKNHANEIRIITKDYSECELLPKIKKCNVLIHLIGIGKETQNNDYQTSNLDITKKIVNLCKKSHIKKIIYLSGLGVSKTNPINYFISKFHAEQEIINSGLNYTIFRPSYIIGKNDLLTKNLTKQIKQGIIQIPGSGKYSLQPISICDVIEILFQSINSKKFSKKILDLVGPQKVSYFEFVKAFRGKNRSKIKKIDLEQAYYDAINNKNSFYGIDDLNILIGNFIGDYNKLKRISGIKLKSYKEFLKTSGLS